MGEVADDMLDGTCCQFCGVWNQDIEDRIGRADGKEVIEFVPPGHPYTCPECKAR